MKKIIILIFLTLFTLNATENKISKSTFNKLQKAHKLIKNNNFSDARKILQAILSSDENKMAKTYALQELTNIFIQNNNYKKAIKNYEQIIRYHALAKEDIIKIKFSLSQLYLSEKLYSKSIKYSKELLNSNFPKKQKLYENLALAYYYNKQYSSSVKYIKLILPLKKDKLAWYKMLYSAYVESKNYNNAVNTMKKIISFDKTNEDYWMQLVSLYQTMRQYKKSLATIEFVYKQNIINKSKNLMYFVNILLQNDIYNKAAILIENGINKKIIENNRKNFNIMISSYLNAKNYKKAILLLSSSSFANTNKYKLILGNIYYNNNEYKKAISTLKNFNFAKNTSHDGQRYTLIALSYYELDKIKNTKTYLKKASFNKYERKRALNIAKNLGLTI